MRNLRKLLPKLQGFFFLFVIGRTIFNNTGDTIYLWCLLVIEDVDKLSEYNWEGAIMSFLFRFMCAISCKKTKSISNLSFVWEVDI